MAILTALDSLRGARTILEAVRASDGLALEAAADGGPRAIRALAAAARADEDAVTGIAAVHALATVLDPAAEEALLELLDDERAHIREHAAWAFSARLPRLDALGPLTRMVADGGFASMLAQRTLQQWAGVVPDLVALSLEGALLGIRQFDARARLVETLGLVPGSVPARVALGLAGDTSESAPARAAAIAALGSRPTTEAAERLLLDLATGGGELAAVARLALHDRDAAERPLAAPRRDAMTIAQLFLHADVDGSLSRVGAGDNGGIATLLVRLGDAILAEPALESRDGIDRVVTLSRGSHAASLDQVERLRSSEGGHLFAGVPSFGADVSMADAWTRRVQVERGLERALRAAGRVDAIHLRMGDVATLAASNVARRLDIPVVFTVAPDPHSLVDGLERTGALDRASFGAADAREHFWFRMRLVQRVAADAAHTVFFPRPELRDDIRRLVGIDLEAHPERHSVVAEGIDLDVVDDALAEAAEAALRGTGDHPAFAELDALVAALPDERRGLPLLVSLGRLHRVKGMATLVAAWLGDEALRARANLLVIGGDLDRPSADEREQLELIAASLGGRAAGEAGLILAGHRPNDIALRWLAAARFGRPGLVAPDGVYVCASVKEEFGIAALEALATGLVVVAPATGGPSTYLADGDTGVLVDTTDPGALAAAVARALGLAPDADRAARARETVDRGYTIEAMARRLTTVYGAVSHHREDALLGEPEAPGAAHGGARGVGEHA